METTHTTSKLPMSRTFNVGDIIYNMFTERYAEVIEIGTIKLEGTSTILRPVKVVHGDLTDDKIPTITNKGVPIWIDTSLYTVNLRQEHFITPKETDKPKNDILKEIEILKKIEELIQDRDNITKRIGELKNQLVNK